MRASATFSKVVVNGELPAELLAVPEAVQPFLRSPEEVAAANERLTREHAGVLGLWVPADDAEGRPMMLAVVDGFLAMLINNEAPYEKRVEIPNADKTQWNQRAYQYGQQARASMTVGEALKITRDKRWRWQ